MAQFNFSIDQKCTIWHRTSFNIEASTKEEAIEFLKQAMQEISSTDELDTIETISDINTVYLYDTVEEMTSEENNGHVMELFDEETNESLFNEFGQKIG